MSTLAGSSSSSSGKPSPETVRMACSTLGYCLGNQTYGIVGGGALVLLGSQRETEDVDMVVPQGETKNARSILRNQVAYFEVQAKTNYTHYKSSPPVEIEILAPPGLFKMPFTASTPIISIDGIKVLKPTLILNAKCDSILSRATDTKKGTDGYDIKYLLWWCVSENGRAHNCVPTSSEVPNATTEFVEWFVGIYQARELWSTAGFDFIAGRFP